MEASSSSLGKRYSCAQLATFLVAYKLGRPAEEAAEAQLPVKVPSLTQVSRGSEDVIQQETSSIQAEKRSVEAQIKTLTEEKRTLTAKVNNYEEQIEKRKSFVPVLHDVVNRLLMVPV